MNGLYNCTAIKPNYKWENYTYLLVNISYLTNKMIGCMPIVPDKFLKKYYRIKDGHYSVLVGCVL
jgi:hypothetical protein